MDRKVINNALSAYFLMGFILLISRRNPKLNHPFIQAHARTATFLHILMFALYALFIWYKWFASIPILGFSLNHILLIAGLSVLLSINFYGAWLASQAQSFGIKDVANITKTNTMVAMKQSNFSEKGAFVSVLALVPLIGFTVKGQYASHKSVFLENNLKINLFATTLICLLFITHPNLAQIFLLAYFIFIAFFGLLMVTQKQILDFSLKKIPTMQDIYVFIRGTLIYIGNYFRKKAFLPFSQVLTETTQAIVTESAERKNITSALRDPSLPIQIAYIPYINLAGVFDMNSQNRFHVINGICITTLSALFWVMGYYQFQIFILFLVFFGWWYLKHKEYVFPFLYDIYAFFARIFGKLFGRTKDAVKMSKEVEEVRFQVQNPISPQTPTPVSSVAAVPTARMPSEGAIPKVEIPPMDGVPQKPENVFSQIGRPVSPQKEENIPPQSQQNTPPTIPPQN